MADDERDQTGTDEIDEPGVTETDDSVLLDLDLAGEGEEGSEGEPEEEERAAEEEEKQEPEEKAEGRQKAPGDLKSLMEEVKEELRGELSGKEKKAEEEKPAKYTHEDLDMAEERLDEMLEEGEISKQVYRQYMRNIRNIRKELDAEEIAARVEKTRKRQTAESAVTTWAEQNAPEFLDGRSKEYKQAVAWAEEVLGAEQRGNEWVLPPRVAQVAFGILWRGQQAGAQKTEDKESDKTEERRKGYEEALRDKKAREEELRTRETKPPKRRSMAEKNAPPTDRELEVLERLGLSRERLNTYRKIKEIGPDKTAIEIR